MSAKPIPKINNLDFEQLSQLVPKIGQSVKKVDLAGDVVEPTETKARVKRSRSYEESLEAVRARSAALLEKKQIDFEARVMQESFPWWDDEHRGVPNPFIRSGLFSVRTTTKREYLPNLHVSSLSNYEINYTGQELQQDDLSVWLSLINLARDNKMSDKVRFTGYQLVTDLGWRMHSESYTRAKESIARLKVTGINITSKDSSEGYSGSLIREYAWADADDNGKTKWMVRFEPRVSVLFMDDTTTMLEWETRNRIGPRAAVAMWLHAFYSSHREPIPLAVSKLHELSQSGAPLSTFRRNLKTALDKLVDVGFLEDFKIVNDTVYLKKAARIKAVTSSAPRTVKRLTTKR